MSLNQDLQSSHKILDLLSHSLDSAEIILDQIPGLLMIVNARAQIMKANQHTLDLFELESEEILLKPLGEILGQNSNQPQIESKILSEYSLQSLEIELKTQQGLKVYSLRSKQIHSEKENRQFHILVGEDITELRSYEQKLLRIFHSTPLGIFSLTNDGTISEAYSHQMKEILGQGSPQGKSLRDVFQRELLAGLSQKENDQIDQVHEVFQLPSSEVGPFLNHLPHKVHYLHPTSTEKWIKIENKPIFENDKLQEILFIIEDQTTLVEAKSMADKSQALYEMALKDPLTGAFTRLHMEASFNSALASHNREVFEYVSLAIFDLDFFKKVNDTYGHQMGDVVLKTFGSILLKESRQNDIVVRFGGEEFVVLLQVPSEQAFIYAERVRKCIQQEIWTHEESQFGVTCSCGIAQHIKDEELKDLIDRADQELYKCKENGRNCIRVSP